VTFKRSGQLQQLLHLFNTAWLLRRWWGPYATV